MKLISRIILKFFTRKRKYALYDAKGHLIKTY